MVQPVLAESEKDIEEVAAVLGASRFRTVFQSTPAITPALPQALLARAWHWRIRLVHLYRGNLPFVPGDRPAYRDPPEELTMPARL